MSDILSKFCSRCKTIRLRTEFHKDKSNKDGLRHECGLCSCADTQARREKNPEKDQQWRDANPTYFQNWRAKNPGYNTCYQREWQRKRKQEDPGFRILHALRTRLVTLLNGNPKAVSTRKLVGCSILKLRKHLENQFRPGMSWKNYGPVWHVDHKKPCSSFIMTDFEQQKECFHFSNLQPLFAKENLSKGAKING